MLGQQTALGRTVQVRKPRLSLARQEELTAYLFILPSFLGFAIFLLIPMVMSAGLSLYDWELLRPPVFIGLDNYYDLARDPLFKTVLLNTAYYASGIGELYTRSSWDTHATWVNLIAGPYTESHAHQDQGALMLYKDGWLTWDAVVDSKSGLRQETNAHGLVRIDASSIVRYLDGLSEVCRMHVLLPPVTHRSDRYGWAGWVHWEASGAHFYAWEQPRLFFSVDIYTCKEFDPIATARFTREFFDADDVVAKAF